MTLQKCKDPIPISRNCRTSLRDKKRKSQMTNAILTDLDGVIRIWSPEIHRKAERATGLPEGAIPSAAFSDDLLPLVITGQISDDEWRRRIADLLSEDFPNSQRGARGCTLVRIARRSRFGGPGNLAGLSKEGSVSPHQQCDVEVTLRSSAIGHRRGFRLHHQLLRGGIRKTRSQHLLRSPGYRGSNSGTGSVHRRQRRACGSGDQIGYSRTHLFWSRRSSAEAESSGASLITLNDF